MHWNNIFLLHSFRSLYTSPWLYYTVLDTPIQCHDVNPEISYLLSLVNDIASNSTASRSPLPRLYIYIYIYIYIASSDTIIYIPIHAVMYQYYVCSSTYHSHVNLVGNGRRYLPEDLNNSLWRHASLIVLKFIKIIIHFGQNHMECTSRIILYMYIGHNNYLHLIIIETTCKMDRTFDKRPR